MAKEFVERRHGTLYLKGSRVPLTAIVREFLDGEVPETIRAHYPTLTLEQVYGAISFYLGNKEEVDRDFEELRRSEEEFLTTHAPPPELKRKLERARTQALPRRD